MQKTFRQGCTNKDFKIRFVLIIFTLSLLFFPMFNVIASEPNLAVSISIVESGSFKPGESFHSIVEIRNSKASGRQDVHLSYEILDQNNHRVLQESTTVAIETLSSFSKELTLPDYSKKGTYSLKVIVKTLDGSESSIASISFNVISHVVTEGEQRFIEYIMAAALIFTTILLLYEHRRISKLKISEKDLKKYIYNPKKK